jgi:hypothetical protein
MAIDPSRAALVVQEYRFAESPGAVQAAAIKAVFDKATEIEIATNLDATGGQALASDIASMSSNYARTFNVTVEDVLYPEDFIGGAPRYMLDFERHSPGPGTYQVIAAKVDYLNNQTVLTVRG